MGARGPLRVVKTGATNTQGTAAAQVQPLAPQKPEDVENEPELSELWDRIVPELDRAGLVSVADAAAVEMCLMHFLTARRAFRALGDEIVVEDAAHEGVKKNPAEAVMRAESEMFLRYAQQLGMTFVSRARTPVAKGDGDGANPFAASPVG